MAKVALALVAGSLLLCGQPPPFHPPETNAPSSAQEAGAEADRMMKTNPPIREISPGVLEMGDVRIDQEYRTVSFPARLNLDQGPMEYFLVTSRGKTHESILKTDTEPFRIHLAMLLLDTNAGAAAAGADGPPVSAGGFISHPSKERLPGEGVSIELSWNVNGRETRKQAGQLIFNTEQKSVMRAEDWVYTGSRVAGGLFLAEMDGSIVSLVTDPAALINNEGPGHDNDTIWLANTNSLPPTNTAVEVSIKLKPKTGR